MASRKYWVWRSHSVEGCNEEPGCEEELGCIRNLAAMKRWVPNWAKSLAENWVESLADWLDSMMADRLVPNWAKSLAGNWVEISSIHWLDQGWLIG